MICLTETAPAGDVPIRVVLTGDSYISSYGLGSQDKFETRLKAALNADGFSVEVKGTGFTSTA